MKHNTAQHQITENNITQHTSAIEYQVYTYDNTAWAHIPLLDISNITISDISINKHDIYTKYTLL